MAKVYPTSDGAFVAADEAGWLEGAWPTANEARAAADQAHIAGMLEAQREDADRLASGDYPWARDFDGLAGR
jgi:hypothetical protein